LKTKDIALAGLVILLVAALYFNPLFNITDIPPPLFVYCVFHPLLSRRMKNWFEVSVYLVALQSVLVQGIKHGGVIEFAMMKINDYYANPLLTFYLFFYWWQLVKYRLMILMFSSLLQYIGFYKRIRALI